MKFPENLNAKLEDRKQNNAFRKLSDTHNLIDFSSNDYLGFARSEAIFQQTHELLRDRNITANGATGSRLISGNHGLYPETENAIAKFHDAESALVFNSGYDANVGFFSSVPQRSDIVLFDELCHASIRDGVRLSNAKSYKFSHNDLEDLENLIQKHQTDQSEIFIATESVFSMDGDSPNLEQMAALVQKYNCLLIVDEAHALGVFGKKGCGLVQELQLQNKVFARIMTFGKGLGCHGAAILGSKELSDYLVNFARSFIYTTGLPPHSLASILTAYQQLETDSRSLEKLRDNILHFSQEKNRLGIRQIFVRSKSAIQSAIIPGNEKVKNIASQLQSKGFDVKAILSPTVPEGQERLRICLHSCNSAQEIANVLESLQNLIF
ncbi:MAG TPA: pyridoxal phosphate-dependent aminotransferase family protein [Flavobacterium sp.]|nr:pyridoxal phosphate-dependent aminotransferase family protein [Flavobacterium sp.]